MMLGPLGWSFDIGERVGLASVYEDERGEGGVRFHWDAGK